MVYNDGMDTMKYHIATNITELRKANNFTQAELAARLNYSDKSISKWERGESLPDIGVLKQIADLFEVTVDYLLCEHDSPEQAQFRIDKTRRTNQIIIAALAVFTVWIVVTVVYVYGMLYANRTDLWTLFVWAAPASCLVALYYNRAWGNRKIKFGILTLLVWSLLAALFVQTLAYAPWPLFLVGIPAQIALCLWLKIDPEQNPVWFPRKKKK